MDSLQETPVLKLMDDVDWEKVILIAGAWYFFPRFVLVVCAYIIVAWLNYSLLLATLAAAAAFLLSIFLPFISPPLKYQPKHIAKAEDAIQKAVKNIFRKCAKELNSMLPTFTGHLMNKYNGLTVDTGGGVTMMSNLENCVEYKISFSIHYEPFWGFNVPFTIIYNYVHYYIISKIDPNGGFLGTILLTICQPFLNWLRNYVAELECLGVKNTDVTCTLRMRCCLTPKIDPFISDPRFNLEDNFNVNFETVGPFLYILLDEHFDDRGTRNEWISRHVRYFINVVILEGLDKRIANSHAENH